MGSYQTAWAWLHKLRRAMVRPGPDRVRGRAEVDERYIGRAADKALVVIAAQEDGRGIGRIRMRRIPDAPAENLERFVEDSVEPGSVVHADGWQGYCGLEKKGCPHEVIVLKRRKETALELLPRVHRVVSLLNRRLLGTHRGAVSPEHLDYYLDEFTFRFNRRASRYRGKLFYRLLQQAVAVEPAPYCALVEHVRGRKPSRHNL